ncbi:MAG: glutamate formimidoyltransferase [Candidatus Delongbacteria bacterium]|jgi:glutamate formiminotransferase/formiminotetrahydrofolate cyclodeaminase|nr:glutamate formimidoyltransferase [Candidatus Delongbacteria bacterium]
MQIIECVPNFSEGRNMAIVDQITDQIKKVKGVRLLDVDPGFDTNRTVVTMVGEPEPIKTAAFNAIKKAHELIDMTKHKGAHPRFGACDVCPIIPVSGITMDECVKIAHDLGNKLGTELDFPIYFYEYAATTEERKNLAWVRQGEYEAVESNLKDPERKPDAGPCEFRPTKGVTAVSARDFLIAYNVSLNTTNPKLAHDIALNIREQGRFKRDENGKFVKNENGKKVKQPGLFKNCKAIGWYVDDYKRAQISINLTNYHVTSMHDVFDEVCKQATAKGLRVTGSEAVGVVPKEAMLIAGKHYLAKQGMCEGIDEGEIIKVAIQSLGLDDVAPFEPKDKIIEYMIAKEGKLADLTIVEFNDLLSTDAPAPGGGSVAALAGSIAASLGSMVMNLTYNKKGYEQFNEETNKLAKELQDRKYELINLIDADTDAFNILMDALQAKSKAKKSKDDEQIKAAEKQYYDATVLATDVPLKVMSKIIELSPFIKRTAEFGNINAASDAGVSALMIVAGVKGAGLNVKINLSGFDDADEYKIKTLEVMNNILAEVDAKAEEILAIVETKI